MREFAGFFLGLTALLLGGVVLAGVAHAQGPVPQGSPIPRIRPIPQPEPGPALRIPEPARPNAPVPAVNVAVRSVVVDGSSAYPAAQLARITGDLTGPAVPLARIEAARIALLDLYRNDGFVLTAVSASVDQQGVLRFVVTEGRIVDVKLDGDIGPAGALVLRFLGHLTERQPIDAATLEEWLLLAGEIPGVTLRAVLRPSVDEPGALTLIAELSRKPFSGLLVADNAAYPKTGPEGGLLVLDADSFTSLGERTELSLYHTSGNTETFGQASSEFYVGGSGLRIRLYAGYGPTAPAAPLRDVGYLGTTTVFGLGATYPVLRRRQHTLDLTASFDAIQSDISTDTGSGDGRVTVSKDQLRILRLGAIYTLRDDWLGEGREAVNSIGARLSQGLSALGASSGQTATTARLGEVIGFTKLDATLSRTQRLFEPWPEANVSLLGILAGQWSDNILPPVEKFYLGGLRLNPGYYSGQVTGDSALAAYAELQLNDSWDIPLFGQPWNVGAQLFAFWSWGETWENQKLDPNQRIESVGGGLRLNLTQYTEFDVLGVSRSVRRPNGGIDETPLHADAVYWRAIVRF